ncbi:MAG: tripartite tricarboxylate transporter substrate-binding protein, partial [Rhodovarius sp.]|nr:tripartite tricarboxylate transporter substrate-binding protein [Rhodovarius sp.]
VMAPAGTPTPILERLDVEIARAMGDAEFRDRLAHAGLEPIHHNRESMRAYIAAQREGFRTAIRAANIRIEG